MPDQPQPSKFAFLHNIHKSPITTILGLLSGALLAASGQKDWHHFGCAIGIALLGALSKEN